MSRFALSLACFAAWLPAVVHAEPLYVQDFDQGPAGWIAADAALVLDLANHLTAPTQPFAQRVTVPGGGDSFQSPLVAAPGGSKLCVSTWIDWPSGAWPIVGMRTYDAQFADVTAQWLFGPAGLDNGLGGVATTVLPIDGWHRYTIDVVLPPTVAWIQLMDGTSVSDSRLPARPHMASFDHFVVTTGSCAEVVNACPTVWAGPPQTAECVAGTGTASVYGVASDPDGDLISLAWSNGAQTNGTTAIFGLGAHPMTLTASDGVCSGADTTMVTVVDTRAPLLTCPPSFTAECAQGGTSQQPGKAIATDKCEGVPGLIDNTKPWYPVGNTTVAWAAYDQSGHVASCEATVSVVDTTPPAVTCPAPRTVECQAPAQSLATSTDACEGKLAVTRLGLPTYPLGQSSETFVAVDQAGNFNACDALVTAADTLAPKITCPAGVVLECGTAGPLPPAQAVDACDSAPKLATTGAVPLQPGKASMTYTATDASGHSASCATAVTVQDTKPPTVTCPGPAQIECGSNLAPAATAWDGCDAKPVLMSSPLPKSVGAHSVTWTGTDASGLSNQCQAIVNIVDTQAPLLVCPAAQTVECGGPGMPASQATDACQGAITALPSSAGTSKTGVSTVTYTAVDASGHIATCNTTQTVVDTKAPAITCPASGTYECNGPGLGIATAVDSCQGAVQVQGKPVGTGAIGKTTVLFSAQDAAGHVATCSATQTVVDTQPPIIQCPPAVKVECGQPVPTLQAKASDTCSPVSVNQDAPKVWTTGTTTVHFTAKDSSANSAACTTSVQVVDTLAPKVTVAGLAPMWPPNHAMQTVTLSDCSIKVKDACEGELSLKEAGAHITCVTSDEPDNDLGDGNKANDIMIVNATTVQLRRERQGPMDGRVYRIGFEVQDSAGHVTAGTCLATVPHSAGKTAVDSGEKLKVCK